MTHVDPLEIGYISAPDDGCDMAVRHQGQNLPRRGNVFYWHPRLPAQLGRYIRSRHLTFGLKQSDHRRAIWVASLT